MTCFQSSNSRLGFRSCVLVGVVLAGGLACSSSVLQRHNPVAQPSSSNHISEIPLLVDQGFLMSGSVVLSKTLPNESGVQSIQSGESRLFSPIVGYIPDRLLERQIKKPRLEINLINNELALFEGPNRVFSAKADGSLVLDSGKQLTVKSIERNPIWYAPDAYFTSRGLNIPRASDRHSRMRRGALGEFALFLSDGQVIHSAQWWTSEVGGWRVSENALKSIFEKIDSGTPVIASTFSTN